MSNNQLILTWFCLIDSFNSDSFALASGGSGFTRVRVKSQTERIHSLGSRLFLIFQIFIFLLIFNLLNFLSENYFDQLRFEPAPVIVIWRLWPLCHLDPMTSNIRLTILTLISSYLSSLQFENQRLNQKITFFLKFQNWFYQRDVSTK